MTAKAFQLILKKDWDYFPHYSKPQGHFVGRSNEKEKVFNWFIRREQGCFLVSGERGVGKTALVYEALRQAKDYVKDTQGNKEIVHILLTAPQLSASEFANTSIELSDRIIQNLIRRLFSEFHDRTDKKLWWEDLERLYRRIVSTKNEIQQHFRSENTLNENTEQEIGSGVEIEIGKAQTRALVQTTGGVIGAVILTSPPFWNYGFNIVLGFASVLFPQKFFVYARNTYKQFRTKAATASLQELYVSDRNVGNLIHDLQDLLQKISHDYKVIFIIDEIDKVEDKDEISLINVFKNLFTLSDGLFVFITSHRTYRAIESVSGNNNQDRGPSYTLYSDKIFVSRPHFSDLEKYLDQIFEDSAQAVLSSRDYRNFRNLLCFRAKSDFFELHYKIRDYIENYEKDGRPILKVSPLTLKEKKDANLQKIIGQVYGLERFIEPSNWHMNNELLATLYKMVETPLPQTPIEVVSTNVKPYFTSQEIRLVEISESLLNYLRRLNYISAYEKQQQDNHQGRKVSSFTFTWSGVIANVPQSPNIKFEYEDKFIQTMNKLVRMTNEVANLELKLNNKSLDVELDGTEISEHSIQPLCDLDPRDAYKAKISYKNGLTQPIPKHIQREELDRLTQEVISHIDHIRNTAATILMRLINRSLKLKKYGPSRRLEHEGNVFVGSMIPIRQGVVGMVHDCLYRSDFTHQILIVQDFPINLLNTHKALINNNADQHLIINLNTKKTEYNLSFDSNSDGQLKGFVSIDVHESLLPLDSIFGLLRNCDSK